LHLRRYRLRAGLAAIGRRSGGDRAASGVKNRTNIAIAGGGLAGTLIALRLRQTRPDLSIALFEQGPTLGGNHTWSFHETDLEPALLAFLRPFISFRWPRQTVSFPGHSRTIETPYASIESRKLHAVAAPSLADAVHLNAPLTEVTAEGVRLASGDFVEVDAVIDARGEAKSPHLALGFQKFVGQEIEFTVPHGLEAPIIMDATVAQEDGYRFLYVLPFTERTALVEDTRYADGAMLEKDALRRGIADYCAGRGWRIGKVLREEEGVLPIALAGDIGAFFDDGPQGVARAGMRAALFHPLTGYSLPDAVALADLIARQSDLSGPALSRLTKDYATQKWQERGFYRLLSRMLFDAAAPEQRYKVLQRFYRLSQPLIERFYAGRTDFGDRARILVGKPPVPISKAIGCVDEARWMRRATGR
jgi:lycopene beta-cyclase